MATLTRVASGIFLVFMGLTKMGILVLKVNVPYWGYLEAGAFLLIGIHLLLGRL